MKKLTILFLLMVFAIKTVSFSEPNHGNITFLSPKKEVKKRVSFFPETSHGRVKENTPLNVDSLAALDELMLATMYINTECRNCSYQEKKDLIEVLVNRVEQNFGDYGSRFYLQILAPKQFSGIRKGKYYKKYFYYNVEDKHCRENYSAAYDVIIKGERRLDCNVVYFLNPDVATNKKEVERQSKRLYRKINYDGYYHRLAVSFKINCN